MTEEQIKINRLYGLRLMKEMEGELNGTTRRLKEEKRKKELEQKQKSEPEPEPEADFNDEYYVMEPMAPRRSFLDAILIDSMVHQMIDPTSNIPPSTQYAIARAQIGLDHDLFTGLR